MIDLLDPYFSVISVLGDLSSFIITIAVIPLAITSISVVADFELAKKMFRYFLVRANGRRLLIKPKIAVCVPVDLTQVERQALSELIMSIGGKDVLIIEEAFAKAVHDIPDEYKIIIEISL